MHKFGILLIAAAHICAAAAAPPSCACARNLRPVCGSDGKTYHNQCLLFCERDTRNSELKIVKEGMCNEPDPCVCTFEYKPVCGTDGNTYPNPCSLRCERSAIPALEVKHQGQCEEVKVTQLHPCTCTREMKEICGSDGNTYNNPCLLNCATQANPSLRVEHLGPCDDRVKVVEQPSGSQVDIVDNFPPCTCARDLNPVCGSDGVTYSNKCLLKCRGGDQVTVASEGPCSE